MIELMLVEGVSDIQLISYYLQNVYGWKYEKSNSLGITPLDEHDHIENLSKDGNQLILCGVGGNGRFAHFIDIHRINILLIEHSISSIMVVTDRDEDSIPKIVRSINGLFENISYTPGNWLRNSITDSFGEPKQIDTYLLIVPMDKKGALENVIIDALKEIRGEKEVVEEVFQFIESLRAELLPELNQIKKANKAAVGTFFSVRNPKHAMRSFASFVSKVDWSESESLRQLFSPFACLGKEKDSL